MYGLMVQLRSSQKYCMSRSYNHPYRTTYLELPTFDRPAAEQDIAIIAESYALAGWHVESDGDGLLLRNPSSDDTAVVATEYCVNGRGQITSQTTYYEAGNDVIADQRTFLLAEDGTLLRDNAIRLYEDDHTSMLHDCCLAFPPAA